MTLERVVAGYPLLRLLALGDRSRLWLVPDDRVLKVLTAPIDAGQPALEAVALHRARGEHVVGLLDVSATDDEVALVFPRLPRGSLADLLATRSGLEAGEAVTILAPLAACVARMHANGVAHGAVTAANVLFSADGAPVLVGFGAALLFSPGLPEVARETVDGVVADRAALAGLAVSVLGRVTGPRAAAAAAFAASLRDGDHTDLEQRLGRELFELAAARPVVFDGEHQPVERWGRVVAVTEVTDPVAEIPHPSSAAEGVWRAVVESGPMSAAREWVRPRWLALSPARRRMVLAAAAAGTAILVAASVVPPAGDDPQPVDDPPGATPTTPVQAPPSGAAPAVVGDDPLVALPMLLGRRLDCFRELSVLCLDDVSQPGSAAWSDDRAALDELVNAGSQPVAITAVGASLVERLGDSALIALAPDSNPASVLLMKGEAGWRIRDYLPPAQQGE